MISKIWVIKPSVRLGLTGGEAGASYSVISSHPFGLGD
jgi:hypothetical protein